MQGYNSEIELACSEPYSAFPVEAYKNEEIFRSFINSCVTFSFLERAAFSRSDIRTIQRIMFKR